MHLKNSYNNKKKVLNIIALIPAREGSRRIRHKNILDINGKPLLAYAIKSAQNAKIFSDIVVSTDSKKYAKIATKYGANVPFLRPKKISKSKSSDYEWVKYTLDKLNILGHEYSHFAIIRPTSPFRTSKLIVKAWKIYRKSKKAESLRAVSLCKEHPGKMWQIKGNFLKPFTNQKYLGQPSFNSQYASLPLIYTQNASLEISKVKVLTKYKTITGKKIMPFISDGYEGFDINYDEDIETARNLVKKNLAKLEKF